MLKVDRGLCHVTKNSQKLFMVTVHSLRLQCAVKCHNLIILTSNLVEVILFDRTMYDSLFSK